MEVKFPKKLFFVRIAEPDRDEIYARHGRMFDDTAIQDYFNSKSWYYGVIAAGSFTEDMLSQIEKDNIRLIKQVEEIR